MIVCRKPCTVYDVDVIGVVALLIIGAAACVGVIAPANANASERRDVTAMIATANVKSEETNSRLRSLNTEIKTLFAGVTQHAELAPRPGALTPLLHRVATLADEYDLQITQVLPQATHEVDGYLQADVWLSARGFSPDFLRLLDRLSRESPYCALRDFSIKRIGNSADQRCQLSWTIRLHMLVSEATGSTKELP
jgi:hypothetical protein